jgi:hypothetical protein
MVTYMRDYWRMTGKQEATDYFLLADIAQREKWLAVGA